MPLTYYLQPKAIVDPLKSKTKGGAIEELVDHLVKLYGISDRRQVLSLITEREKSMTTFLPMGVAIPHARSELVEDISMVCGIAPGGIKDTGEVPTEVHVILLFLSPEVEKEFGKHLKLLARISAIFSEPGFDHELAVLSSADEIFTRLQQREREIDER